MSCGDNGLFHCPASPCPFISSRSWRSQLGVGADLGSLSIGTLTPGPHRTRQRYFGPVCDRPIALRPIPSRQNRLQASGGGFDGPKRARTVANRALTALTGAVRTGRQTQLLVIVGEGGGGSDLWPGPLRPHCGTAVSRGPETRRGGATNGQRERLDSATPALRPCGAPWCPLLSAHIERGLRSNRITSRSFGAQIYQ